MGLGLRQLASADGEYRLHERPSAQEERRACRLGDLPAPLLLNIRHDVASVGHVPWSGALSHCKF